MHRVENTMFSNPLLQAIKAIEILKDTTIIFSIHPRTYNALKEKHLLRRISNCTNLKLIQPLGYVDFIKLAQNSKKIITDSGGIQKEAYLLQVPCITVRQNTEWIETVDQGWNKLTQNNTYAIVEAVRKWFPERRAIKPILGKGNTSVIIRKKILLLSSC
jgi:UDP-N-acetylglucosamine 2-epimerase (non-hydrolysing)